MGSLNNQGLFGAISQYWDVEPKARLHRRNSYFNDHEVSNVQALRVGIVVSIATAMVVVWGMVGGIL